jgi:hypothetical protein
VIRVLPLKVKHFVEMPVRCAIDLMRPIGLVEVSRTGVAAMSGGPEPAGAVLLVRPKLTRLTEQCSSHDAGYNSA